MCWDRQRHRLPDPISAPCPPPSSSTAGCCLSGAPHGSGLPIAQVPTRFGCPPWLGVPPSQSSGLPIAGLSPLLRCPNSLGPPQPGSLHTLGLPTTQLPAQLGCPHSPGPPLILGAPSLGAPYSVADPTCPIPCSPMAQAAILAPAALSCALWPPAEGRLKGTSLGCGQELAAGHTSRT